MADIDNARNLVRLARHATAILGNAFHAAGYISTERYLASMAVLEATSKADQPQIDSEMPTPSVIKRRRPDSSLVSMNGVKVPSAMKRTATLTAPTDPIELERWLNGIVRLKEGAALRGVHPDTLRREAARGRLKLIRISERAIGIRRRVALMLEDQSA
jgi:hypothetical protein